MENDKLSTTESTLASPVPNGIIFNEAEYRKNCIQNRIRQLQTEIWVLESQIKSSEGNGLLKDDSGKGENVRVEEGKLESFKIQENILKSQVGNFISNVNLLEDELRSSILKISCIKDNIKRCFVLEENSEFTSASFIAPNCSNLAVPVLDSEHDRQSRSDNSFFEGSSHSADPEKEQVGVGNKLSQDVMELIFKQNLIITTRDLLNFRCVNRTWRDAATSILLIKDSCQLNLELKSIPTADKQNSENRVYCRRHPFNVFPLTDLLPIIRASRKFPTTSLNFSVVRPEFILNSYKQIELLQFFKLYGEFIKSISIGISISTIELEDLLSQYTPNLECLKFNSLSCISDQIQGNLFCQPKPGICSSLKVIFTGASCLYWNETVMKQRDANVKALLYVATHLESIKNVHLELSKILVEEQKVHLIKELIFEPRCHPQMVEMTNNLVAMNPKLSVLNMVFEPMAEDSHTIFVSALNTLLESSKDTLECFKIAINLYDFPRKIRIPRLKNLKNIKFTENIKEYGMPFLSEMQDPIFEFPEATAGHKLFPNLRTVNLSSERNFGADGALMRFFPYHLNRGDGSLSDNCVPSVKVLQIFFCKWLTLDKELPTFPRLFPNIRHLTLTINCKFEKTFQNSFWNICPLAESVEIIIGWHMGERHYHQPAVDSFFTGFSSELCSKLRKKDLLLKYLKDKELIDFLRVKPSICDLQYLKFLTVRFFKSTSCFISKVTGLYAFQQMPQMKVTFTCDPSVGIEDRKKMQRLCSHLTDFVNVDIDTTSVGNGTLDHESVTKEHLDGDILFTDSDTDISSSSSYCYNSDGSYPY